jgi:hypothetical protein
VLRELKHEAAGLGGGQLEPSSGQEFPADGNEVVGRGGRDQFRRLP